MRLRTRDAAAEDVFGDVRIDRRQRVVHDDYLQQKRSSTTNAQQRRLADDCKRDCWTNVFVGIERSRQCHTLLLPAAAPKSRSLGDNSDNREPRTQPTRGATQRGRTTV